MKEYTRSMKEKVLTFFSTMKQVLTDDRKQRLFMLQWINRILALVSVMMTVVNIITDKRLLMYSTLIFAVLCFVNVILCALGEKGQKVSSVLLAIELLVLFTFFLISGETTVLPEATARMAFRRLALASPLVSAPAAPSSSARAISRRAA